MLGIAWAVINPLAMIVVYTVIFSKVMHSRLPGTDNTFAYSIYLCAGILTWGLFSEIITRSQNIFIENANLLKKLSFPRICLPVVVVGSALLNFSIVMALFLLFLILSGNLPGLVLISSLVVLVIQVGFAIGLGVTLGVLNVFFRDVGQLFTVILQFWFWLTPIVYSIDIIPKNLSHYLMLLNPMAPIIGAYQTIFALGKSPDWNTLLIPALISFIFCAIAMRLFRKHAGEMVDEL